MDNDDSVIFREAQYLPQSRVVPLAMAVDVVDLALMYAFVRYGMPASIPVSGLVAAIFYGFLAFAGTAILFLAGIRTEVRADGLYMRYFPFHASWRKISLDDVKAIQAVTFTAKEEYSGWGIAYKLSGNQGMRIEYTDGRRLLIGSQKAEELTKAIESLLP